MSKMCTFKKRNKKECINSYNWFQIFFTTKACPLLWKYNSLDGFDEKPNHKKNSKFWNFEGKGYIRQGLIF
jgi:hypothetical protein